MSLEKVLSNLEKALSDAVIDLPVNPQTPDGISIRDSVYFDRSETTDAKWKSLAAEHLKAAMKFEIHCWNEEAEWIQLAMQYGELKQTDWQHGKVIVGMVTPTFAKMLLELPKPNDTDVYNKMTPFFNVFLDDHFDSSHYGTEVYL